jgi:hypothetical protein
MVVDAFVYHKYYKSRSSTVALTIVVKLGTMMLNA